ncbi:MAG: ATP-dependent Clp protease ATP-binding subunit ClpX, partial [Acidobacteria bacterium]|nr:ATP-dependent Clp protease ATP-binding subunit ClpX [Acidobacteriota bacterium]
LVRILTEPKNALVRQYQRLFDYEGVRLEFTEDALETIARMAQERKMGARGLRMILEDLMLELMYHLPSQGQVQKFSVTRSMVENQAIDPGLLAKAG